MVWFIVFMSAFIGLMTTGFIEGAIQKERPLLRYRAKRPSGVACEHCDFVYRLPWSAGFCGWLLKKGRCGNCKLRLPVRITTIEYIGLVTGIIAGLKSTNAEAWITVMGFSMYCLYRQKLRNEKKPEDSFILMLALLTGVALHLFTGEVVSLEMSVSGVIVTGLSLSVVFSLAKRTDIWLSLNDLLFFCVSGAWLGILWSSRLIIIIMGLVLVMSLVTRNQRKINSLMNYLPSFAIAFSILMLIFGT